MIRGMAICWLMLVFAVTAAAQDRFIGNEPPEEMLGAPRYPGAVFLRADDSPLDPYFFQSALYVTPDEPDDVIGFFRSSIDSPRVISYEEAGVRVWTFLLAPWILLNDNPPREDLLVLESSPNIQVKLYTPELYEPLVEYYTSRGGFEEQLEAMDTARTVIRYTYEQGIEDEAMRRISGSWLNTARELEGFYGSVIRLTEDGSYSLEMTDENIRWHAGQLSSTGRYSGMDIADIVRDLKSRNPETGEFNLLRHTISLYSEHPVVGTQTKSGLATVKTFSLTLQLVNMPVLTFIKQPE